MGEFIFPTDRHLMLKVSPRQSPGTFHQLPQWVYDAAGDRQAQSPGEQEREHHRGGDKQENSLFDSLDIQNRLRLLFTDLAIDFLDQRGGQRLEWVDLGGQANVDPSPVARGGQAGDSVKLRLQRALNDFKGGQDAGILLRIGRQEAKRAFRSLRFRQEYRVQS